MVTNSHLLDYALNTYVKVSSKGQSRVYRGTPKHILHLSFSAVESVTYIAIPLSPVQLDCVWDLLFTIN